MSYSSVDYNDRPLIPTPFLKKKSQVPQLGREFLFPDFFRRNLDIDWFDTPPSFPGLPPLH